MCVAPQQHALFRHSDLLKVFRTTCDVFSRFSILTAKRASRHSRVHIWSISTAKIALDVRCFYFDFQMCFAPQRRAIFDLSSRQMALHPPLYWAYLFTCGTPTPWENAVFRDFSTFLRAWIFFLLRFSSLIFSLFRFFSLIFFLLPFSSLTLPTSAFPSVHLVKSLTSKLRSVM